MTPERWQKVNELFHASLECEESQRSAFLDEACAGDPELRREVEILLASDRQAARFMEQPAFKMANSWPADRLDMVGRRVGPYQILKEIGRGGMGAVYLAERTDGITLAYRTAKFIKRNKAGVIAAALVAAVLLALVAIGLYLLPRHDKAIDSIAVLPFVNVGADPNTEYLSDGITESLINGLSQLPKLRVMARTTMFSYKGRAADPQKVGRDLNVRAVLTGQVVQRGDTLVVQADLVDPSDGSQLWGQQYNRKLSDILTVQEEIAREISKKLRLTSEERAQLMKRYTDNTEAYQLYINGSYCLTKRTEEEFKKAIEYFERTIAKDPNYALAYSGMSHAYNLLAILNAAPPREVYPKAKAAAEKALALDDRLAEAYTALGYVKMLYEWDRSGAERAYQRALELSPNDERAHLAYALYLGAMGREREAIAEIKRAQVLDPLSQPISTVAGIILYWARRYDQAAEQFRNTIEVEPNFWPHLWLGQVYAQKGMYRKALEEARKARDLSGDESSWLLGYIYAVSGEREAAQKVIADLKELSKRRYISPYDIAQIYAGLGEKDRAFEWLEKAYEDRSRFIDNLKVNPGFDPVRTDARFADFLRRVNLPP